MASRITEDGVSVLEHTLVWEVVYRYINAETSVPEAEQKEANQIPENTPVWFAHHNVQREILRRNKKALKSSQSAPKTENPIINER